MKITAEDVLKILVRVATQFLALAWEKLGDKKKIIEVKE